MAKTKGPSTAGPALTNGTADFGPVARELPPNQELAEASIEATLESQKQIPFMLC